MFFSVFRFLHSLCFQYPRRRCDCCSLNHRLHSFQTDWIVSSFRWCLLRMSSIKRLRNTTKWRHERSHVLISGQSDEAFNRDSLWLDRQVLGRRIANYQWTESSLQRLCRHAGLAREQRGIFYRYVAPWYTCCFLPICFRAQSAPLRADWSLRSSFADFHGTFTCRPPYKMQAFCLHLIILALIIAKTHCLSRVLLIGYPENRD